MLEIAKQFKVDFNTLDRKAVFALIYAAVGLTLIFYLKDPKYLNLILSNTSFASIGIEAEFPTSSNLYGLLWWCFVSMTFYFVIPAIFVVSVQKRKLSEFGLAAKAEPGFLKLLGICIAIMLPIVYLTSLTESFSSKYPFLHFYELDPNIGTTLLIWELVYFLQFFGLEFFFRGFLVHSLKPSLGLYSVLIMTVPYVMIHFQKPIAETFAAVLAGLFLGWISYKNGTIWLGLVLHCTVALSMDLLVLYHKGFLF